MIHALIVLLVAALAAVAWKAAQSSKAEAPEAADAVARLAEIDALVMDPQRMFSISETLAELDAMETRLPPGDIAARGQLLYLRGFVLYRAGRPRESLPAGLEALRIQDRVPFLPPQAHGRFAYNMATQAEELGEWATAIDAYRMAIPQFEADPAVSEDQRLGTRERLAYCLHEAKRYDEAMEINREVLAGGERLFGADSDKLLVVIANLAQNAHALDRPDAARSLLERRLDIATRWGHEDVVDDSLFQLGVLAFETGDVAEAEAFMTRRLDLANASGDARRIANAQNDLDVLAEKLGR
ncbi:tetratricopeptide repeat protein [Luteimonas sp. Y-2-2-4F]|nr:tetratricopeptide repeat protein [Luteimonas sp. Y-2-2-4F]